MTNQSATTHNPARFITAPEKLAMLHSMKDLDGTGRFYELDYTIDYMLDKVLMSNHTVTEKLFCYIGSLLFDRLPKLSEIKASFGASCSAFAATESVTGNKLMGRNFDFNHYTTDTDGNHSYIETSAIILHTAPTDGYKSVAIADGWNMFYGRGFYTDGKTDLSLMTALPYACLDGINEAGFAICVLALNENQTKQNTGKNKIATTVAIRLLLDKAASVKEAIELLGRYDIDMEGNGHSNYHFFMADASGRFAIVEYTFDKDKGETTPHVTEVFTDNDIFRCVTNFYISPTMKDTNDGWHSDHGKARFLKLHNTLNNCGYRLNAADAMNLLKEVSQKPDYTDPTSCTQWSALYDLTEKTVKIAFLRNYANQYFVSVGNRTTRPTPVNDNKTKNQ